MEAVGRLTGGVAHDFNNLLTVIRSSADLLRMPGLAPEKRKRYLDAIAETADRAAALTSQLLAFARRQALKPEIFDVGERVAAMRQMLETSVGSVVLTGGYSHVLAEESNHGFNLLRKPYSVDGLMGVLLAAAGRA